MDLQKVAPRSAAFELAGLLDSPEIAALVSELESTRWTGRPGYPIRAMVGMALAKSMYVIPTWTRTARLVAEHAALRAALGCEDATPSEWACYRFAAKLRAYKPLLDSCIAAVLDRLREANPGMGENIAIDGSDLPAYANGQRFVSKNGRERALSEYSDPDASWGHRSAVSTRKGGGYYGYKVHAAVDTLTGLPMAWTVETAKAAETTFALGLLDAVRERGFAVATAIMARAMTTARSTTAAWTVASAPSRRFGRPRLSSAATTLRASASTESGPSPEPTTSGRPPSGAARPATASRSRCGSRPTGCTR